MMKLASLQEGQSGRIYRITADTALLKRLRSFGVEPGSTIAVLKTGPAKSTIQVQCGTSTMGLRHEEAECIEVQKDGEE